MGHHRSPKHRQRRNTARCWAALKRDVDGCNVFMPSFCQRRSHSRSGQKSNLYDVRGKESCWGCAECPWIWKKILSSSCIITLLLISVSGNGMNFIRKPNFGRTRQAWTTHKQLTATLKNSLFICRSITRPYVAAWSGKQCAWILRIDIWGRAHQHANWAQP